MTLSAIPRAEESPRKSSKEISSGLWSPKRQLENGYFDRLKHGNLAKVLRYRNLAIRHWFESV